MALPYTLKPISEDEKAARAKLYTSSSTLMVDMVVAQPYGVYLPKNFENIAKSIYNLKLRPDDVFMLTYPKAGSTWTQEMLWQISHGVDLEKGQDNLYFRSPFLELSCLCGDSAAVPSIEAGDIMQRMAGVMADSVGYVENMASPRIIKTHLPLEMLPPNLLDTCKVIWVTRNVKDSVVSWYHHEQLLPVHGFGGSFEDMAQLYMKGQSLYGSYWTHLKSGWAKIEHPNMKRLRFEDMKSDLKGVIGEVAKFLGKTLADTKVDVLLDHLSFDNFKNNPAVNMKPPKGAVPDEVRDNFNFIRKGQVGDWKNYFQGDHVKTWDDWIAVNNPGSAIPITYG